MKNLFSTFILSITIVYTIGKKYDYIDKILSAWNTTYDNLMVEETFNRVGNDEDEISEDLTAIFPSDDSTNNEEDSLNRFGIEPSGLIQLTNKNVVSYALPRTLFSIDHKVKKSGVSPEYQVNITSHCKDNIVIQQRTFLLSELKTLLPHRSVMFISCKNNRLPKISLPYSLIQVQIDNKTYDAKVINSVMLIPGLGFEIDGQAVTVDTLESTYQIIGTSNIYLNIKDKTQIFDPAQFSYRSSSMKEAMRDYANIIPFSQTMFIQIYAMGTSLNTSYVPTNEDRRRQASFHDLFFCSPTRKCNGESFQGRMDTPYGFKREDNISPVYLRLHKIMTQNISDYRYRQTISQRSQFPKKIIENGFYCYGWRSAFVYATEKDYKANHSQNELPHELGHSYDLLDYAGDIEPESKLIHYSLDLNLNIILPYTNKNMQRKGSMNSGNIEKSHYTRLNRYSSEYIYERMKKSSELPKSLINDLKTGRGESLIIVNYNKDIYLFKVNINIEKEIVFMTEPCLNCDTTIVVYSDSCNSDPITYYTETTQFNGQRIPHNWLTPDNVIVIKNEFIEKLFYLPNEAIDMIPPYPGIRPEYYKQLPITKFGDDEKEIDLQNRMNQTSCEKKL